MILNFSFKNFQSFAEVQQFSMEREKRDISDNQAWIRPDISAVTAIYGPNASGKSTFLEAFNFVSRFVRLSDREGDAFSAISHFEPFLLDEQLCHQPTDFLIEFIVPEGEKYVYSFTLTSDEILEEELIAYFSNQPTKLFSRFSVDGDQHIEFGSSLKGPKRLLWDITRRNALFLSVAGSRGKNEKLSNAYRFLTRDIVVPALSRRTGLFRLYNQNQNVNQSNIAEFLRHADFGIEGFEVQTRLVENESLHFVESGDVPHPDPGAHRERKEVYFLHKGPKGNVKLSSNQESEGTLMALSFYAEALGCLERGRTMLIDELDMSLHPTLVREFVALFANPETNPNQAQLIFTTHDVSLISVSQGPMRVLDRDQVWFCEKDDFGRTELIPATDYSPRREENLGRNYLNGVYGALPRPSFQSLTSNLVKKDYAE